MKEERFGGKFVKKMGFKLGRKSEWICGG